MKIEIAFVSFDTRLNTYLYGIKVDGVLMRKRRFKEFLQLKDDLQAEKAFEYEDFPSKYFRTNANERKPRLEKFLLAIQSKFGEDFPPLKDFLGVKANAENLSTAARRVRVATMDEEAIVPVPIPSSRVLLSFSNSTEVLFTGVMLLTAAVVSLIHQRNLNLPIVEILLVIHVCSILVALGKAYYYTKKPQSKMIEAHQANGEVVTTSLLVETENESITTSERQLLRELCERLADFANPNDSTLAYEEAWLISNRALIDVWYAKEVSKAVECLNDRKQREKVFNVHVARDFRLVEMLRAQGHNIDKAEEVTRFTITARLALKLDEIHARNQHIYLPPRFVFDYGGCPLLTDSLTPKYCDPEHRMKTWWLKDREGRLCAFTRAGPIRSLAIYKKMQKDNAALVKSLVFFIESLREDFDFIIKESKGKTLGRCTLISDMSGFELQHQMGAGDVLGLARVFIPVLAPAYCGILHRAIIINAPWYVSSLVALIRPFVPKDIMDTISIHGTVNLEKHILPYVDKSQIPKYLGGELTDPNDDPFCPLRVSPRGPYLPDKGESLLKID